MKDAAGTDLARVVIVGCAADPQPARIHLAVDPLRRRPAFRRTPG